MCKHCDCDNIEKCSIVGYMPIGYCCSLCNHYEENQACIHEPEEEVLPTDVKIKLIKSEIKNNEIFVKIEKDGREFQLKIDLRPYLK